MTIRADRAIVRTPVRAAGLAVLVVAFAFSTATPVSGQTVLGSDLAGVTFPAPAQAWTPTAEGFQAATLDLAASLAGSDCGPAEYHLWPDLADPQALRASVDGAFEAAGWRLDTISVEESGARSHLAERDGAELVMSWLPAEGGIGLLLCSTVASDPGAEDGSTVPPLPTPRPEDVPSEAAATTETTEPAAAVGTDSDVPSPRDVTSPDLPQAEESPDDPNALLRPAAAQTQEAEPIDATVTPAAAPAAERTPAERSVVATVVLLLVAAAAAVAAFFLFRRGFAEPAGAKHAHAWPTTLAAVIYSQVASQNYRDRKGRGRTRYVPAIAYEYVVGGKTYRSARLRFGSAAEADAAVAARVVARFPVGAGIEIHYDPKNPAEATIEADPENLRLALVGGVALAVLAVAGVVAALG